MKNIVIFSVWWCANASTKSGLFVPFHVLRRYSCQLLDRSLCYLRQRFLPIFRLRREMVRKNDYTIVSTQYVTNVRDPFTRRLLNDFNAVGYTGPNESNSPPYILTYSPGARFPKMLTAHSKCNAHLIYVNFIVIIIINIYYIATALPKRLDIITLFGFFFSYVR